MKKLILLLVILVNFLGIKADSAGNWFINPIKSAKIACDGVSILSGIKLLHNYLNFVIPPNTFKYIKGVPSTAPEIIIHVAKTFGWLGLCVVSLLGSLHFESKDYIRNIRLQK